MVAMVFYQYYILVKINCMTKITKIGKTEIEYCCKFFTQNMKPMLLLKDIIWLIQSVNFILQGNDLKSSKLKCKSRP
jgi:hypothetical protein